MKVGNLVEIEMISASGILSKILKKKTVLNMILHQGFTFCILKASAPIYRNEAISYNLTCASKYLEIVLAKW